MDFNHTEERILLAETIARFFRNEYSVSKRVVAGASALGFDVDQWSRIANLGVMGALFTEHQGGFGGNGFDVAVVFEALGRGLVVEPLLDNALRPGTVLARAGDIDRVARIIAGSARYALADEETDGRYDPTWVTTTANADRGAYVLSGTKTAVKFADSVDGLIVSARTRGEVADPDGISLFMVGTDMAGVLLYGYNTTDGGRSAEIELQNVHVPATALVCVEGAGFQLLSAARDCGLVAVCAEALGIMEQVKDMTLEYLRTRKQFGTPIGRFQALRHRMAQILLDIEQARSAVINAAAALDTKNNDRAKILSAAKYTIGRVGTLVAEEAIQLHGGIGMTWEYDLAHFAKRLIMIDHELGDEDYHLARYAGLG